MEVFLMNLLRNPRTRVFLKGALALTLVANFATVTWALGFDLAGSGYDVGLYCQGLTPGDDANIGQCIRDQCHKRATGAEALLCREKAFSILS
jgi:hypothetical protein